MTNDVLSDSDLANNSSHFELYINISKKVILGFRKVSFWKLLFKE